MVQLNWVSDGLGITATIYAVILLYFFRKKIFGYFDPLAVYIATRAAAAIAVLTNIFSLEALNSYVYVLSVISFFLFIVGLYIYSPNLKESKIKIIGTDLNILFNISVILCLIKISILFISAGSLPIFGDSGSDSYINFAEENKLATSFIFAIGSSELILLSFLMPLIKGGKRYIIVTMFVISLLMHLSAGKKASLLSIFLALSLGDYLRAHYTDYKNKIFTGPIIVIALVTASLLWAAYIFNNLSLVINHDLSFSEGIILFLDWFFIQWGYPVVLFSSGELRDFFNSYSVNKALYFFHTALTPFGLPAFESAIGTSIHEYQTGELTGNGINPTYFIEGYVLVGFILPLYAWFVGVFVSKIRSTMFSIKNPKKGLLFHIFLLSPIYIFPSDSLLFMKIIFALVLMTPLLYYFFKK